jgi:hypothetical protein
MQICNAPKPPVNHADVGRESKSVEYRLIVKEFGIIADALQDPASLSIAVARNCGRLIGFGCSAESGHLRSPTYGDQP